MENEICFEVIKPFVIRVGYKDNGYYLRFKQGALVLYFKTLIEWYMTKPFERIFPDEIEAFKDNLKEIELNINGMNILKVVSSYNYHTDSTKQVAMRYDNETYNKYLAEQAKEFNNR